MNKSLKMHQERADQRIKDQAMITAILLSVMSSLWIVFALIDAITGATL